MIPQETIAKIFDSADIVDVISDFVNLKKSGSNFKGLSPFSNEKTPSFMVSPAKGIFKDFSSGKGGNVVTFLMEHDQLNYPEALKWLARKYNIEIVEETDQGYIHGYVSSTSWINKLRDRRYSTIIGKSRQCCW